VPGYSMVHIAARSATCRESKTTPYPLAIGALMPGTTMCVLHISQHKRYRCAKVLVHLSSRVRQLGIDVRVPADGDMVICPSRAAAARTSSPHSAQIGERA
jgi:hypothetical protein